MKNMTQHVDGCIQQSLDKTDLNIADTSLIDAMLLWREDLALLCLEAGADPNAGTTRCKPIHIAVAETLSPDFLKKLIAAGADVNMKDVDRMTALHLSCSRRKDNREITQILLDAGADPTINDGNGFSLSDHAMMVNFNRTYAFAHDLDDYDSEEFHKYLFPINQSHARLIQAAKDSNLDFLKSQLQNAVPDKIKTLALHETLWHCQYSCCQLLLDNGADPNAVGILGDRPLIYAAAELEIDIASLLHSYGADLEAGSWHGQKPLYLVCEGGIDGSPEDMPEQKRFSMASMLLGRGAEVDGADNNGWTPLRQAVLVADDMDLARLLLEHGAKPDKEDNTGITTLQLAEQHCSPQMVELLRGYIGSSASNCRNTEKL